jgi:hypothetical protein
MAHLTGCFRGQSVTEMAQSLDSLNHIRVRFELFYSLLDAREPGQHYRAELEPFVLWTLAHRACTDFLLLLRHLFNMRWRRRAFELRVGE